VSLDCSDSTSSTPARPQVPTGQGARPLLRGVSHQYAAGAATIAGLGLVLASQTATARLAMLVYALALVGLFTVSALYHRITWSPESRHRWRRFDHAMVFVLIAGPTRRSRLWYFHLRSGWKS
jgi:hemolysin III